MTNKEIKITVPEGYEIDKENSTFECIKFKKKVLTYGDIARALFGGKTVHYIKDIGSIGCIGECEDYHLSNANNASSVYQLERLLALNKLMNVAEYLNEKTLNWNDNTQQKLCIYYNHKKGALELTHNIIYQYANVYFDSGKHAKQAIEILGEDTIKLALGVDQ